jgi:NitT/TauT family transport system substrate-binding protein
MRKIQGLFAACICCMVVMAPAWGQALKLAIGYVPNGDFVPVFVAQDKGYFAKAGLETTLTPFPIPPNVPAAITARSIDVGPATGVNLLQTGENGLGLVAVSGYNRNLAGKEPALLMMRTGLTFNGPADLVGKRVGIAGILSTFDAFFRIWLHENNVPLDQVKEVEITYPPMSDMLKSGQLDAVAAVEPFRTQIVKNGTGFIAADFMAGVSKDCVGLVWAAQTDWAVAHPRERAAFIAALKQGIADTLQDPKGAAEIEAKYLKFSAPVTDDFNLSLTPADLQFYADLMTNIGFLHQKLNVSELIVQ